MFSQDEIYMQRCLQLAKLGAGYVSPNPMVGAVLVFDDRIIGEGYHKEYGKAHAEVNCINAVQETDKHLIEQSTLYVSLEPCAHFGKTPPCSDLIIRNKIQKVVIGCRDPFKEVNGRGIEKLKTAGIEVVLNVLEKECIELNKRFFTFHQKQRPYIILKWAQTINNKIAYNNSKRLLITNKLTNRLVHRWRSHEAGILVGTNTAASDNPLLTNRLWSGKNPVRIVIDKELKLNCDLNVFNNHAPTIFLKSSKLNKASNEYQISNFSNKQAVPNQEYNFPIINIMLSDELLSFPSKLLNQSYYYELDKDESLPVQIAAACYKLNVQSLLIEGGALTLQSFINKNFYDEIRIITNEDLIIQNGLDAPDFDNCIKVSEFEITNDRIEIYKTAK